MANRAYLHFSAELPPAWIPSDADTDQPETEKLFAKYRVPLFWVALFQTTDLRQFRDPDITTILPWRNRSPYLACSKKEAITTFASRKVFLSRFLASADTYFPEWESFLSEVPTDFVSVDFTEINDMDGKGYRKMRDALQVFEKPSEKAFGGLLAITSLVGLYDPARKDFQVDTNGDSHAQYIVGLPLRSDVPWFQ